MAPLTNDDKILIMKTLRLDLTPSLECVKNDARIPVTKMEEKHLI